MINTLRTIKEADLQDKRVLLRTGWDVPLIELKTQNSKLKTKVADDLRIRESLPTIRYLIEHGAAGITIATHLGRPGGRVVPELSVEPVVEKLIELLPKVIAHQNPNDEVPAWPAGRQISNQIRMTNDQLGIGDSELIGHSSLEIRHLSHQPLDIFEIMGLPISIKVDENLRFDPREAANGEALAKELARDHDLYINDAFSNCHREHASMVAITKFLPAYAGLLVEDEIKHLSLLQHNPSRPFVVVIGGAKIEDKMGVIEYFAKHADTVLLGGKTGLEYAKHNDEARMLNAKSMTKSEIRSNSSLGNLSLNRHPEFGIRHSNNIFPPIDDLDGFDIGPKTIQMFVDKVKTARTIFWNGNMGMSEDERYATGTRKIAQAIADSAAKIKIVGGGDTIAFIHQARLSEKFTFLSSGGGATIDYLAGQEMPGLEALRANQKLRIKK